jgi:hypothetical protein
MMAEGPSRREILVAGSAQAAFLAATPGSSLAQDLPVPPPTGAAKTVIDAIIGQTKLYKAEDLAPFFVDLWSRQLALALANIESVREELQKNAVRAADEFRKRFPGDLTFEAREIAISSSIYFINLVIRECTDEKSGVVNLYNEAFDTVRRGCSAAHIYGFCK